MAVGGGFLLIGPSLEGSEAMFRGLSRPIIRVRSSRGVVFNIRSARAAVAFNISARSGLVFAAAQLLRLRVLVKLSRRPVQPF